MKRIIHMSDLHVGYKDFGERFRFIISNLIFEKGDKPADYIIVITGDLVDDANNKESYSEIQAGLNSLRTAGFKHILVVPGNHDYGTGNHGNKRFVRLFKQTFFEKEIEYPKLDIIAGIAFIGLDSMAEELHWHDKLFSEGELGKKQLSNLETLLHRKEVRSCKRRVVYLHHHPFHWRPFHQLKDSKKLREVLSDAIKKKISIDAILYGHNHEGKAHNGQWKIPRCYDAGSGTLMPRPTYMEWLPEYQVRSSIRVINIGKKEAHCDYVLPLLS